MRSCMSSFESDIVTGEKSEVQELQARLAEFRPRLAARLGIPAEMIEIERMPLGLQSH